MTAFLSKYDINRYVVAGFCIGADERIIASVEMRACGLVHEARR